MKEYALYKGEELLCIGTIKEISLKLNIKESTVRQYSSAYYQNRFNGNKKRILICLD